MCVFYRLFLFLIYFVLEYLFLFVSIYSETLKIEIKNELTFFFSFFFKLTEAVKNFSLYLETQKLSLLLRNIYIYTYMQCYVYTQIRFFLNHVVNFWGFVNYYFLCVYERHYTHTLIYIVTQKCTEKTNRTHYRVHVDIVGHIFMLTLS